MRLICDERGNLAISFALVLPVLMTLAGLGSDYAGWLRQGADLREATDAGAVAAARELMVSGPNGQQVLAVADSTVRANVNGRFGDVRVGTSVLEQGAAIEVTASRPRQSSFAGLVGLGGGSVEARSVARLVGGGRICVVALETAAAGAVQVEHGSQINGNGCGVYANSANPSGILVKDNARITADLICTVGGANIKRPDLTQASPTTACPPMPDPLGGRTPPSVGGCTFSSRQVINGGTQTLAPGVYCGGLEIRGGAQVTLSSGTYVMRGGSLEIRSGGGTQSSVTGRYVGFYFTDPNTGLKISDNAIVDLTAPKADAMAGILFWQNRTPTSGEEYFIASDYVRNLTGAIYLPRARFRLTGNNPMADQSPWTAVIARQIEMKDRAQLVLNTNYNATDVPVPGSLKSSMTGAKVYLAQ